MADEIILIPDSVFFVKRIDAPEGLSGADVDDYVATSAESFSPIPSDRLACGYVKRGASVTVFCTMSDKVSDGYSDAQMTAAALVIPTSALLATAPLGDGTVCLSTEHSIAAIEIKDGAVVNFAAIRRTGAEAGDMAALQMLGNFQGAISSRVFSLVKCQLQRGDKIDCEISEVGGSGDVIAWQTTRKALLSADLRDKKMILLGERQKRKAAILALAVKAIPLVFILLLFWQILLFFRARDTEEMEVEADSMEGIASAIEMQSEQIGELRSFTTLKLHSIENIAYVNSLRPDDVYFSQVIQEYGTGLTIKGRAPTIGAVEAFVTALRNDGNDVKLTNSSSNKGEAVFTLSLKLK